MKCRRNRVAHFLMFTIIIIFTVFVVGCISQKSDVSQDIPTMTQETSLVPTPTVTPIYSPGLSSPKYSAGDIVNKIPDAKNGRLIIDYNSQTNCYRENWVYLDNNGKWVYSDWNPDTYNRELEERDYPFVVGHVNPQSVTKFTLPSPTPGPKYSIGDIVGRAVGESTGLIIYGITPNENAYSTIEVHYRDGEWVYLVWDPLLYRREIVEEKYPVILGHMKTYSLKAAK